MPTIENGWIGVDFDGTIAVDVPNRTDPYELGAPIQKMVDQVKSWIAEGYEVRIFTARMAEYSYTTNQYRDLVKMEAVLKAWCLKHIGVELECTNVKDGRMFALWDDRAVQVINGQPALEEVEMLLELIYTYAYSGIGMNHPESDAVSDFRAIKSLTKDALRLCKIVR